MDAIGISVCPNQHELVEEYEDSPGCLTGENVLGHLRRDLKVRDNA